MKARSVAPLDELSRKVYSAPPFRLVCEAKAEPLACASSNVDGYRREPVVFFFFCDLPRDS